MQKELKKTGKERKRQHWQQKGQERKTREDSREKRKPVRLKKQLQGNPSFSWRPVGKERLWPLSKI